MANSMETHQFMQQSLLTYLRQRVVPIIEPLQFQILLQRPADIHEFSYAWLQNSKKNEVEKITSDEEKPDPEPLEKVNKKQRRYRPRHGVSGEIHSNIKIKEVMNQQKKCDEERMKILSRIHNFVLLKNLPKVSVQKIVQFMKIKYYEPGQIVVQEGDVGNQLFLVDSGTFKCFKKGKKEKIESYGEGDSFGELALLYNTRRACTIIAETKSKLFSLDRLSFTTILRENSFQKHEFCEQVLNKNELFEALNSYEKNKLIENIKEITVGMGKYIIREGQFGDRFYIVAEGKLVTEKMQEDGSIKPVFYYKEGDYFGEIALIRNIPRQASIRAMTSAKLLYIERSSFKRLLGPLEDILKRNQERYRSIKTSVKNKTTY